MGKKARTGSQKVLMKLSVLIFPLARERPFPSLPTTSNLRKTKGDKESLGQGNNSVRTRFIVYSAKVAWEKSTRPST